MVKRDAERSMLVGKIALKGIIDHEQSFALVLWGWLRSYAPDYNRQKGELLTIEEVGKLLHGKQDSKLEDFDPADASPVPVSLKTQGSYISQRSSPIRIDTYLHATFREKETPFASRTITPLQKAMLTSLCAQTSSI